MPALMGYNSVAASVFLMRKRSTNEGKGENSRNSWKRRNRQLMNVVIFTRHRVSLV